MIKDELKCAAGVAKIAKIVTEMNMGNPKFVKALRNDDSFFSILFIHLHDNIEKTKKNVMKEVEK